MTLPVPTAAAGGSFTQVSAGLFSSLALDIAGNAWAWGYNEYGQSGNGSNETINELPTAVEAVVAEVTQVSFGGAVGAGLTDNGDGTVSVATPPHAAGSVDVTVEWTVNGVAQEPVVYAGGFTYVQSDAPSIVVAPKDVSVVEGKDATFTVEVTGQPEPSLQWQVKTKGGQWVNVGGASTGSTLVVKSVGLSDDGSQYRVVATNSSGQVTSQAATLTVTAKPVGPVERGERFAGLDRYGTNLALLKATFEAGDALFVATVAVYPDALSAGPAAVVEGGSLALTPPNTLNPDLKVFLEANKPSKINIIGGKGAVSASVADQLGKIADVERVWGKDRYETSLEVFKRFFTTAPVRVAASGAFVATGQDFPDALSASAAGGSLGQPVVLALGASAKELPAATVTAFKGGGAKDIHIVGGTGAVNKNIEASLTKAGFKVDRQGGKDRYETNLAVNSYLGIDGVTGLWVATGNDFPDGLSAAIPASGANQRLVLAHRDCIPGPVVPQWIKGKDSTVTDVILVGGTGVLTNAVQNLAACAR